MLTQTDAVMHSLLVHIWSLILNWGHAVLIRSLGLGNHGLFVLILSLILVNHSHILLFIPLF